MRLPSSVRSHAMASDAQLWLMKSRSPVSRRPHRKTAPVFAAVVPFIIAGMLAFAPSNRNPGQAMAEANTANPQLFVFKP